MPQAPRPAAVIRVLLAEVPGWRAAVVQEAIETQSDMTTVKREVRRAKDLSAVVTEENIDVVVTSFSGTDVPSEYQKLLFGSPYVPLVAINADGRMEVYTRKVVREIASEQLVEVIREAAKDRERPIASNKQN